MPLTRPLYRPEDFGPAEVAAQIAAYHLELDAPPVSHSQRSLIVTGTLLDSNGNSISTPFTIPFIEESGFWQSIVGDIEWYVPSTEDTLTYNDSGNSTTYSATGSVPGTFTPTSGTGNAAVNYASATIAPSGSTATENGNVWKNIGTLEEPTWVRMIEESELDAKANLSGGNTFSGTQVFSSTSRPSMPSVSGTPSGTDAINLNDLIGRGGRRLSAQLTTDETGNDNTTTLRNSATLTLALEPGLYNVEALIIVSAGTGFATVGSRQKISFTGTGTFAGSQIFNAQNGSASSMSYPNTRVANTVDAELLFSANSSATLRHGTLNVTVAGNLVVQFAQRTAGIGSPPVLNSPSYLRAQRIS